nr:phosphodiester glycosidase family protein [Lachnospiraceae bacterium]
MPKARFIWAIAFSVLLTAYTTFAILDTFVIPQAAVSVSKANTINVASGGSASNSGNAASEGSTSNSAAAAIITENSYESDDIKITISETTYEDTQVYIADIYVSDPSKLMTGLANGTLGKNITQPTSDIAESC